MGIAGSRTLQSNNWMLLNSTAEIEMLGRLLIHKYTPGLVHYYCLSAVKSRFTPLLLQLICHFLLISWTEHVQAYFRHFRQTVDTAKEIVIIKKQIVLPK